MTANKGELKMIKTEDKLINAISVLLKVCNLENISVNDVCKEAQIDRAVFYAYFADKHDLLNYVNKN